MPKAVAEISTGNQFSRSSDQGALADSATRTFRVLLNSPDEVFDIQSTCGVFIGDAHPTNVNIACNSFDAKYEGDTRMVLLATFNYGSEASAQTSSGGGGGQAGGPKTISPEYRPASWSISTEIAEVPLRGWRRRTGVSEWAGDVFLGQNISQFLVPTLPRGQRVEGLTRFMPMTTIKFTQFVLGGFGDPTAHCRHVGKINSEQIRVSSLDILPHELMLRSINATPTVEPWGGLVRRGWNVEYSFLFKPEVVNINYCERGSSGACTEQVATNIGWDAAIIVEGRNVVAYDPADPAEDLTWRDPYALPLQKGSDGTIIDPDNLALTGGVAPGEIVPAHVRVAGFSDRNETQAVANDPVALNADGTPRKLSDAVDPLVWAYQIYEDINMTTTLGLRLD